jgi:hypothetical protein
MSFLTRFPFVPGHIISLAKLNHLLLLHSFLFTFKRILESILKELILVFIDPAFTCYI